MFIGVDHTAIASRNPLQLANWYVDYLEFQVVAESQSKYFISAPNGSLLEIIPGNGEASVPGMTALGVRHIALGVHNIEAARQQLCTRNIEFITDIIQARDLDLRVIFFRDPEGNIFHLIERGGHATPNGSTAV
jgi:catechol 2,3-dioxygenase-like lactoylglutathione lyase family enzyme